MPKVEFEYEGQKYQHTGTVRAPLTGEYYINVLGAVSEAIVNHSPRSIFAIVQRVGSRKMNKQPTSGLTNAQIYNNAVGDLGHLEALDWLTAVASQRQKAEDAKVLAEVREQLRAAENGSKRCLDEALQVRRAGYKIKEERDAALEHQDALIKAGNALYNAMDVGMNSIVKDAWKVALSPTEAVQEQSAPLENYILMEVPGESSCAEGAIDVAIRILSEYQEKLKGLKNGK